MNVRRLRYFIAVAREMSFTRAAERMNVVQPALSAQVKRLEDELGVRLFDRSRRAIELTTAGRKLFDEGSRVLDDLEQLEGLVKRLGAGAIGSLTVEFPSIVPMRIVTPTLRRFREENPNVELRIRNPPTKESLADLESGRADVVFLFVPESSRLPFAKRTIERPPLLVALPPDHPRAKQRKVDLATLAEDEFILPNNWPAPDLHEFFRGLCREAGFETRVSPVDLAAIEPMLALAAEGFGDVFVPGPDPRWEKLGAALRPLTTSATLPLCALWREDTTQPTREAFLAMLPEDG
jgi:DNA-binding transcriptional LysR family regulator